MYGFFLQLNNDVVVYARIEGFSGDPDVPLVLSNGGDVYVTKRLRKLSAVPVEENALGYEPHSGHYRNLSEYSWEGRNTSSSHAAVDLAANVEEMEIEESAASATKSTPSSRKRGAKGKSNISSATGKTSQNPDTVAPASAQKATPKRGARRFVVSSSQESELTSSVESSQYSSTSATSLAVTVSPPTSQLPPQNVDEDKTSAHKRPRMVRSGSAKSPPTASKSAKREALHGNDTGGEVVSDEPVAKRLTRSSK